MTEEETDINLIDQLPTKHIVFRQGKFSLTARRFLSASFWTGGQDLHLTTFKVAIIKHLSAWPDKSSLTTEIWRVWIFYTKYCSSSPVCAALGTKRSSATAEKSYGGVALLCSGSAALSLPSHSWTASGQDNSGITKREHVQTCLAYELEKKKSMSMTEMLRRKGPRGLLTKPEV